MPKFRRTGFASSEFSHSTTGESILGREVTGGAKIHSNIKVFFGKSGPNFTVSGTIALVLMSSSFSALRCEA
ncbi:hypothetical protein BBO01nite_01730 [Brevibacillus borstelensis]|nr:hypothetical protein BBO01nite_01730 [Brevibacillus borstelensis]